VGDDSGTEGGLISAIKGAEVVATQPAPLMGSRLLEAARLADEKVGRYARREAHQPIEPGRNGLPGVMPRASNRRAGESSPTYRLGRDNS